MASAASCMARAGDLKSGSPAENDKTGRPADFISRASAETASVAEGLIFSALLEILSFNGNISYIRKYTFLL
jgi:hypothetical protein